MRQQTVFRRRVPTEFTTAVVAPSTITLSDDQAEVFERVLRWQRGHESGLLTLGGFAGTGKSTVVAEVARELRHLKVAFVAYTGKAANVLQQKLRAADVWSATCTTSTIHSLIYEPLADPETGVVLSWERRKVLDLDLIVVDEASMVNLAMLNDLQSYGIPIWAVGDHGQLPPVSGEGTLMRDPELRLERTHRQAEGSPIIKLSQVVRECGDLPRNFDFGGAVQLVTIEEAEPLLRGLYEQAEDVSVLTYTNRARQQFNCAARFLRYGRVPPTPEDGDSVICLRNTQRVLFNGMRGVVRGGVHDEGQWWCGDFHFPDDALEVSGCVLKSQVGREKTYASWEEVESENAGLHVRGWEAAGLLFDYGYALTVHKSMGSGFKHVFLLYEKHWRMDADEWRRWLYTGLTRSKDHLYVMVP